MEGQKCHSFLDLWSPDKPDRVEGIYILVYLYDPIQSKTMNKYLISFLVFLVSFCVKSSAQHSDSLYFTQIKIAPFKMVFNANPGVEISVERLIRPRYAVQVSYVFLTDIPNQSRSESFKGYQIGLEGKLFQKVTRKQLNYISTEFRYLNATQEKVLTFTPESVPSYTDTTGISRKTVALNFKLGRMYTMGHFVIDIGFGVGLKYKNISHSGRINTADPLENPTNPNVYYPAENPGKGFTLNLPVTLRLGYAF